MEFPSPLNIQHVKRYFCVILVAFSQQESKRSNSSCEKKEKTFLKNILKNPLLVLSYVLVTLVCLCFYDARKKMENSNKIFKYPQPQALLSCHSDA